MNKEEFISFINNPSLIDSQSSKEIQQIVEQYPYFQSARILFLKSLYDNKSISYQSELKLTAVYAGNRAMLQAYILKQPAVIVKSETDSKQEIRNNEAISTNENSISETQHDASVKPSIRTIIEFDFNEPNQAFELPKITEEPKEPLTEKKKQQLEIIDRFIKTEPRIVPKENTIDYTRDLSAENPIDTEFMTETLAEIYVKQKKYDKAIVMFQKLSLKFPQKSVYFASRISDINTIVNQDKK
jgi:tetratricopeptide (TPR) repeat protein